MSAADPLADVANGCYRDATTCVGVWQVKMMTAMTGVVLAMLPQIAWANSDSDAVKTFIKAVKQSADLSAAYRDAVSAREAASLRRVQKCEATNLMKQTSGEYTVVWVCTGGALGMRVTVNDGKVTAVSTFEVEARPNSN